ncbi:hypothetical protein ACQR1Y_18840 [Bradyrhizobium sp. HKCCYLRH3099]|uniref:hypothetical protein n=1 Tax=unclassified Bradyrhizobium TaxID=2631580 RepID=UPI003EB99590
MSVIFDSYFNIVRVTEELEHLPQSGRELFGSRSGMSLAAFSWNKHEEWGGLGKWLCRWASLGADVLKDGQRGLKVIGRVILCTDLYRDRAPLVQREKLAHAEMSLLTCCFIAGRQVSEETYDVDYLKFTSDGWPIYSGSFVRHAGGRLLEHPTEGKSATHWHERSWLFTVPLEAIQLPQDFRSQVSEPFWKVLSGYPEDAFTAGGATCGFPEDPQEVAV